MATLIDDIMPFEYNAADEKSDNSRCQLLIIHCTRLLTAGMLEKVFSQHSKNMKDGVNEIGSFDDMPEESADSTDGYQFIALSEDGAVYLDDQSANYNGQCWDMNSQRYNMEIFSADGISFRQYAVLGR